MRGGEMRGFRIAWNILCGIPMVMPSHFYENHVDHHNTHDYGTSRDGEYLPLATMSPIWILVFLSQALWVPPLAILRFGILTPLTWFSPALRRLIHQRASSLVIDPSYIRPLPTATAEAPARNTSLTTDKTAISAIAEN